jgi:hypothetical protein
MRTKDNRQPWASSLPKYSLVLELDPLRI